MAPGTETDASLPGLSVEPLDVASKTAHFDLIIEFEEHSSGLICRLKYNTDLFDVSTIGRMERHLRRLFESVSASRRSAWRTSRCSLPRRSGRCWWSGTRPGPTTRPTCHP